MMLLQELTRIHNKVLPPHTKFGIIPSPQPRLFLPLPQDDPIMAQRQHKQVSACTVIGGTI